MKPGRAAKERPFARGVRASIATLFAVGCAALAAETPDRDAPVEEIVIYGSAPLPGIGQPLDRVPTNVQQFGDHDVAELAPLSTTDFLGRRAASVHLEQTQNNPFQPDLLYRGFTSSFLLGTPQGLSIFKDGVRLNEFLGDAMNWDLVPEDSLASIEFLPGANPVYGRNTLGGAIALTTKSGRTDPGSTGELSYGSFERFDAKLSHGGTAGADGAFDFLATGDFQSEDGFRDFSRSHVAHVFLRGGWRDPEGSAVWATYDLARNELRGNGSVPESLLEEDRSAVFTHPDEFQPNLDFVTVHGSTPWVRASRFTARATIEAFGSINSTRTSRTKAPPTRAPDRYPASRTEPTSTSSASEERSRRRTRSRDRSRTPWRSASTEKAATPTSG